MNFSISCALISLEAQNKIWIHTFIKHNFTNGEMKINSIGFMSEETKEYWGPFCNWRIFVPIPLQTINFIGQVPKGNCDLFLNSGAPFCEINTRLNNTQHRDAITESKKRMVIGPTKTFFYVVIQQSNMHCWTSGILHH
jgi:hypothetical protein